MVLYPLAVLSQIPSRTWNVNLSTRVLGKTVFVETDLSRHTQCMFARTVGESGTAIKSVREGKSKTQSLVTETYPRLS